MTPAEWLAALILGWQLVANVWYVVDKPVTIKYHSNFYLLMALCYIVAAIVLALVILI